MEIKKMAMAGSLESNDTLITVKPNPLGRELVIESIVEEQFGAAIRETLEEVLEQFNVQQGYILVQDRGALDCTLRARLETALLRAQGGE